MVRICKICKEKFKTKPAHIKKGNGKFCSFKCYGQWRSVNTKGKNNHRWKGNKVGYFGVHDWIEKEKGKAKNYLCSKKDNTCSKHMNWSNISGKYLRDLSDWQILCRSHHIRFDMTDDWRKNLSESHKKYYQIIRCQMII